MSLVNCSGGEGTGNGKKEGEKEVRKSLERARVQQFNATGYKRVRKMDVAYYLWPKIALVNLSVRVRFAASSLSLRKGRAELRFSARIRPFNLRQWHLKRQSSTP